MQLCITLQSDIRLFRISASVAVSERDGDYLGLYVCTTLWLAGNSVHRIGRVVLFSTNRSLANTSSAANAAGITLLIESNGIPGSAVT